MSNNTQKMELESLSSLSVDQSLKNLRESNNFGNNRKSSFDLVNILKDSDQYNQKPFRNSFDLLTSNIGHSKTANVYQQKGSLQLNDEDKNRIEQAGQKPIFIGEVHSESEKQSDSEQLKLEPYVEDKFYTYKLNQYLPADLAKLLKERQIPLQYVKGLLYVKNQKEIKSVRRLKVERYLQKRRNKTWDRKICYNCRQKVAQQRLRVKGKFIKKRRALQILGITVPTSLTELKKKLEKLLKDKDGHQIQEIIKMQNEQENQM